MSNISNSTEAEWIDWRCAWTRRSADEAYERDQRKIRTAQNNGFTVVTLWRGDGKEYNYNKCITEINLRLSND